MGSVKMAELISADRAYNQLYVLLIFIGMCIAIQALRKLTLQIVVQNQSVRFASLYDTKITFIGVIHHEIGHALLAILTGAKVLKIQLIKRGDRLGAVYFRPRGPKLIRDIQMTIVQIGPILFGSCQLLLISMYIQKNESLLNFRNWIFWVLMLVIQQIVYHMQLQKQDIRNLMKGVVPQAIILYLVIYVANINISLVTVFIKVVATAEIVSIALGIVLQAIAKILRI